jgi:enterochelin esterase-like enzyme
MLKFRNMFVVAAISVLVLSLPAVAQNAPATGGPAIIGGMGAAPGVAAPAGAAGRGAAGRGMMMGGRGGTVRSPEILSDKKVTFHISAPQAASVSVSGDWGSGMTAVPAAAPAAPATPGPARGGMGGTAMTKDANGLWTVTVGPLDSEIYGYTLNIDGARIWDPANNQLRRDGSNITSVLIVPGDKGDMYSIKDVPHGTVAKVWYDSPTLNLKRRMYVYTPAGYETSNEKYPVFFLLHGTGGDEDAWTSMGRAPQILDNLIAAGKAKPMIVVMTNGNAWQTAAPDALPTGASGAATDQGLMNSPLFPQSIVKDVLPFMEKAYRVMPGKENRAVAGLSMGGGHTIMATNGNPGVFGYVGVFSSGPRENYRVTFDDNFKKQLAALKESVIFYYVGCGLSDTGAKGGADNLANSLKEYGFNYKYSETPGGHTWNNWRIYLSEFATLIFK